MAPLWRWRPSVPSVQIKNVPPEVHEVLCQRARAAGQSLQEYLLAKLTAEANEESLDEVLARAGRRDGGDVPFAFAVESSDADRAAR